MNCLWIARDLPFALDAGDKTYSANMARSLQQTGVSVRMLGFQEPNTAKPQDWVVDTVAIPGQKHQNGRALFSRLPIAAAIHVTSAYRAVLDEQLQNSWDVIVLDSYGSGWALDRCMRSARAGRKPALVYLSHNHEETLWRAMAADSKAMLPKKLALWQNYCKVRALERRMVQSVDLVATITGEDAQTYTAQAAGKRTVVLTPGYSGWVAPERRIDEQCPPRVVLVGSFRWVVKQENLRQFLESADQRFKSEGIHFDVIGDIPKELRDALQPHLRATRLHGFVQDIAPFFSSARMAVVPELIGGGFKLKFLDYIFGRVPVASLSAAAAGLPEAVRAHVLCREDLRQLVEAIVEFIAKPAQLDLMQQQAFEQARALFKWQDRGLQLRRALESVV